MTPQDFGAIGDGVADDTNAFKALAAKAGGYFRVPPGRYLVKDTLSIREGQVWQFENAQLLHEGPGALFQAVAVNDWALLGAARFQGAGAVATSPPNLGLVISNCRRFKVSKLQFWKFSGAGIVMGGSVDYVFPRGDRGQFSDLGFTECARGIEVQASAASEYNIFSNMAVTACGDGIVVAAGNCQFIGGNVVDCRVGIMLLSGPNHGHGAFSGFNLNHSSLHNLYADGIELGYSFNGCHFYGDGELKGSIMLRNSKGILIQGGQLDCTIVNDGKTGKNFVLNNVLNGANFKITSSSGDAGGVICRNAMRLDGSDACQQAPA